MVGHCRLPLPNRNIGRSCLLVVGVAAMPFVTPSLTLAEETVVGFWVNEHGKIIYGFGRGHAFLYQNQDEKKTVKGSWYTGDNVCREEKNKEGQTGNLMIEGESTQCCFTIQQHGKNLVLTRISAEKPLLSESGYCQDRVLTRTAGIERERQTQSNRAVGTEQGREVQLHMAVLNIRQKVDRNWKRPTGTVEGLQCTVRARLAPNGDVVEVVIVSSSGDEAFDGSALAAVYKASPLPLPEEKKLFEYLREIEFLFKP